MKEARRRNPCATKQRVFYRPLNFDRWSVSFVVFLLFAMQLFAPYANSQLKTHPALQILFPRYSYSGPSNSLDELDLKNSDFVIFGGKKTSDLRGHLRRGSYEKLYKVGGHSVGFEWLKQLGEGGSEPEFAIAYYSWTSWAASSSDFGIVHLLRIKDGHLYVVQQILFNTRGSDKAGAFFDPKSKMLTIRGVNDWEHCCPTGLDVVQFQLKDGVLQQVHYGTAPL